MKGILLLAALHAFIIYQSRKTEKRQKNNFLQYAVYAGNQKALKSFVFFSLQGPKAIKSRPGFASLVYYDKSVLNVKEEPKPGVLTP